MKRVVLFVGLGLMFGLTSCGPTDEEIKNREALNDLIDELEDYGDDFDDSESDYSDALYPQDMYIGEWLCIESTSGNDDLEFFGDGSYLSMPKGSGGEDWYAGYFTLSGDMLTLDEGLEYTVTELTDISLKLEAGDDAREYLKIEEEDTAEEY